MCIRDRAYSDQMLQLLQLYCTLNDNVCEPNVDEVALHTVLSCADEIVILNKKLSVLDTTCNEYLNFDVIHLSLIHI